jgi:hypothetical protein
MLTLFSLSENLICIASCGDTKFHKQIKVRNAFILNTHALIGIPGVPITEVVAEAKAVKEFSSQLSILYGTLLLS